MRGSVRWERLELHGFGRHDHVVIEFPTGLSTLVKPNEWGKSTIVAGLTAVLFGLPAIDDASQFGARRFRSWTRPGRFEGSLVFVAADDRRYTLERRFEDHGVRLSVDTDDGPEVLHDGAHNPRARKRNERFEEELSSLLGVRGRDVFLETFCVTQPLPGPDNLSDEVQRLLVGSGRGTVDLALANIVEQVTERTRYSGRLGVTRADRRSDGERERLEAHLREVDAAVLEGREAADRSLNVTLALAAAQEQVQIAAAETERLQAALEARREYLSMRRHYEERRAAQRAAERVLDQAVPLEQEATEAQRKVEHGWPALAGAPEDLVDGLARLQEAARRANDARRSAKAAGEAAEAAEKMLALRQRSMESHATRKPTALLPSESVEAVEALEGEARRAVADWHAHRDRQATIDGARQALETYGPLRLADEADQVLLRRYDAEAAARIHALEASEAAAREARAERRRLLVPDATLPSELEAEAIRAVLGGAGRTPGRVLGQVALAVLAAVALYFAARTPWLDLGMWAVAPALLGGLTVGYAARPNPTGLRSLDRFRGRPFEELVQALEAYEAWRSLPAPSRSELRALEVAADNARESLDDFSARMRPFQEIYAEPGVSYEAMREDERRLAQREALQSELSQRVFGAPPEAVAGLEAAAMPEAYAPLVQLLERRAALQRPNLETLCEHLAGLDAGFWQAVREDARNRTAVRRAWLDEGQRLAHEVARAESVVEERNATLTQRRAESYAADGEHAAAIEPYRELLEATGLEPVELLQLYRERDRAIEAAERPWDALASLLAGVEAESVAALRDRLTQRQAEVVAAYEGLDDLARRHPDLPPATVDDASSVADSLKATEHRAEEERLKRDAAQAQIFELTRRRSELLGMRVVNLAQAEEDRARTSTRLAAVGAEIDALVLAHQELTAAVHDFQGGYRERLERLAGDAFALFAGVPGRRVRLADDFGVSVLEPDGTVALPSQLSQGAQDQLVLALRLAIADHMAEDAPLPMLLDDPFLNWDHERLERARRALATVAGGRQIVLLSHRPEFRSWGAPARVSEEN